MRQQHYLVPTLRDNPADAEAVSHQLMVRAGFLRQLASGIYTYLPLGQKVLRKVQDIVREEMNESEAQELLMPSLHPAESWKESGRWDIYGPELMRLKDRHDREFALGPTHEEVITSLVRDEVKSYKKLPLNLYQIQTKYRDERRPRFGLLRGREFVMKDAYSFDASLEGLDEHYKKMYAAYTAIFTRCGLNFRAVEADSGAIGGSETHEFMALSEVGEDTIAYCNICDYTANIEKAQVFAKDYSQVETTANDQTEAVDTPGIRTVKELTHFLQIDEKQVIKTLAFRVDEKIVIALVRGDYELNDIKLKDLFDAQMVELLPEKDVVTELHSVPGFLGPAGLKNVTIVADYSVRRMRGAVVGANEKDKHLLYAQPGRDFEVEGYYDLRNIVEGDQCPQCRGIIELAEGIEIGQVFKLGTKYSEPMGATYLDENGKEKPLVMGCYGIGISRTVAAIVEQHHDENGIVWPAAVAPFHLHLIAVNMKDEAQQAMSEELYLLLKNNGYDVLFDDRNERPGVKFKDADLIGLPIRLTVGKKAAERIIECKIRRTGEVHEVSVDELDSFIKQNL